MGRPIDLTIAAYKKKYPAQVFYDLCTQKTSTQ